MNTDKRDPSRGKLPLPSPRSPRELDDRILSYARSMAPDRQPWLQRHWAAGLATAGVLVLAVFITVPEQPAPRHAPSSDQRLEAAPGNIAAKRGKVAPAALKAPAVDKEFRILSGEDEAAVARDTAAPLQAEAMAERTDIAASSPVPAESLAKEEAMQSGTAKTIDPEQVVQRCAALIEAGESQQARQLYRELQSVCPDCGLPDTLEQALSKFKIRGDTTPKK